MSWQTYVDNNLMAKVDGNQLSSAAILGQDGSVLGRSSDFPQVKTEEIAVIMKVLDEGENPGSVRLGSLKYFIFHVDSGKTIEGKKQADGVTIGKTKTTLVVGIYNSPMTSSQCYKLVGGLSDFLVSNGF